MSCHILWNFLWIIIDKRLDEGKRKKHSCFAGFVGEQLGEIGVKKIFNFIGRCCLARYWIDLDTSNNGGTSIWLTSYFHFIILSFVSIIKIFPSKDKKALPKGVPGRPSWQASWNRYKTSKFFWLKWKFSENEALAKAIFTVLFHFSLNYWLRNDSFYNKIISRN